MESVRIIAVPYYDSLSIRRNWQDIQKLYPDILHYFPNYDPEFLPSRKYFWEVFASLYYDDAKVIIQNERKRKFQKEASEKTKEISISKDVLDLIQGSLYYSKKKGRALFNIKPKEYEGLPKRKRRISELEGYEGSRLDVSVFNKDRESKRSKHEDEDTMCNIAASRNRKEGRIENSNPFKKTHGPSPSSSLQRRL